VRYGKTYHLQSDSSNREHIKSYPHIASDLLHCSFQVSQSVDYSSLLHQSNWNMKCMVHAFCDSCMLQNYIACLVPCSDTLLSQLAQVELEHLKQLQELDTVESGY